MLAIFRKDLKLYFSSFTTYIILGVMMLAFGILVAIFNLFMGYASLVFSLGYMILLETIAVPLLSLLSFLRERKSNSEKLLLSLPISPASIVLGRFFSALTVLSIPTLLIALTPLLFLAWGTNSVAVSEMAVLGYLLFCALLLSITQFIFSLVKRKWLAATLAFLIPILFYIIYFVFSGFYLEEIADLLVGLINPVHHFNSLTYGALDLAGIFYLLSFCTLFLLLNILILQKRKGGSPAINQRRGVTLIASGLLAGVLILNIGVSMLPQKITKFDVSGLNIFRISGNTVDLLRSLDEDVTIYYLCKGGAKNADSDIRDFLNRYDEESDFLRMEIIDTEQNPDFINAYTRRSLSDQSMLVVSKKRHQIIDFNDLYYYENAELNQRFSSQYYNFLLQTYLTYLQNNSLEGIDINTLALAEHLFYSTTTSAYFAGESLVTNAIHFVSSEDVPTIYISLGEGFSAKEEYFQYFQPEIQKNGFFVKDIDSLSSIPADCDLLILFAPEKDLREDEKNSLHTYLENEGKFYLFSDCDQPKLPSLYSVLSEYGLFLEEESNLLCEGNKDKVIVSQYNIFQATVKPTPITDGKFSGVFAMITPHSIVLKETEGVTLTPWITTSDKGYLISKETDDEDIVYGTFNCGVIAEKGNTRIAWISSPLSVSYTMGQSLSSGGNYSLLLSSFQWMTSSIYKSIYLSATLMNSSSISLTDGEVSVWSLIFIIPIPLATLALGGIRTYVRKKK